jgi:hypothetical protein
VPLPLDEIHPGSVTIFSGIDVEQELGSGAAIQRPAGAIVSPLFQEAT